MNHRTVSHYLLFVVGLVLWMTSPLHGQDAATGAIAGTLYDSSGALITHALVNAVEKQTHFSRSIEVSSQGTFRLAFLPPGTYSVTVESEGFEHGSKVGVPVIVGEVTSLSFKLPPGKVDVLVDVDITQPQTIALGRVVDESTIQGLPLANRNYTQILALSPGVVVELVNAANLGKNNQNVSANGAGTTNNNFQFNGIDSNNLAQNSASGYQAEIGLAIPAPDVIEEFKAQTAGYDAAYGRGSGANVDVISKSGTNHFHGSAWEFLRNDALNANDFFLKANGQPRAVLKQDQFGATLGGPIRRDKIFLFLGYQGFTQRNGEAQGALATAILPQLTADRSAATLGAQFCPANHPGNAGYLTFAGGTQIACDGSNINPAALALLNYKFDNGAYAIPSPQTLQAPTADQIPLGQSTFSSPAQFREDQFTVNLDIAISDKNELAGRFFYSHSPQTLAFAPFGPNILGWGNTELDQNHMFVLSDTHAFNANLVNVARFGFMRFDGFSHTTQPITAASVGMATPGNLPEIPGLTVGGLFTIGTAGQPFYWQNTNTYVWQDTVSWTHGHQSIRAGIEFKRHQLDVNVPYVEDGFLSIRTFSDFLVGQSAAQNGGAFSNIDSSSASSGIFPKYERYTDYAGFVQDDVKLNPRLTINAGLRYEIFGAPSEIQGRLPTFDPTIASMAIPPGGSLSGYVLPANYTGPLPDGVTKSNTRGLWATPYYDVSPRLGLSYMLSQEHQLLLRVGYGIHYNRTGGEVAETTVAQPPYSFKQSLAGAQNNGATLQNPYSPALPITSSFPDFLPRVPNGVLSLAAVSPHLRDSYTQQYNLNIQYGVGRNTLFEVGYVGSASSHLSGQLEFNQALLASPTNPVNGATTNTAQNVVQRLPFQGIAAGSYIVLTAFSAAYNSLQTSVTQKLNYGLELLGSYTWSKELNVTSDPGAGSNFELGFVTNDQTNPRQARGLGNFDRANRGVVSLVYTVPHPNMEPAIIRQVISNWSISTIAVAQSGSPIVVTDSNNGSIYGNISAFSRAQCTGAPLTLPGPTISRLNNYFNPAAFTTAPNVGGDPQSTFFGNCGTDNVRGPGQRNIDLALARSFPIKQFGSLQFRTEFFNATNTTNFANPDSNRADASFGSITAVSNNPRIIQFALKYSY